MKNDYDLTTVAGLKKAAADARRNPIANAIFGNPLWLAEIGFGLLEKAVEAASPAKAVKEQAKAAAELIKAGKENGVKKMKITIDEQAGVHFESPIEGVKVAFSVGSKGKTTLEVEYS